MAVWGHRSAEIHGLRHSMSAEISMTHVQDLVRPLVEDESQKKERRKLDKFITLSVQQISGTQQQVHCPHLYLFGHNFLLHPSHCSHAITSN